MQPTAQLRQHHTTPALEATLCTSMGVSRLARQLKKASTHRLPPQHQASALGARSSLPTRPSLTNAPPSQMQTPALLTLIVSLKPLRDTALKVRAGLKSSGSQVPATRGTKLFFGKQQLEMTTLTEGYWTTVNLETLQSNGVCDMQLWTLTNSCSRQAALHIGLWLTEQKRPHTDPLGTPMANWTHLSRRLTLQHILSRLPMHSQAQP